MTPPLFHQVLIHLSIHSLKMLILQGCSGLAGSYLKHLVKGYRATGHQSIIELSHVKPFYLKSQLKSNKS